MECESIPSELNDINIIRRIGKSLGTLIGFEVNKFKTSKIRFLVKINQSESNRKIITNRSIYRLTFTEYTGKIDKIIGTGFNNINFKNNLKKILRNSSTREEKEEENRDKRISENKIQDLKESEIVQVDQKENTGKEEEIEHRWRTNMDFQHLIERY